jgi:site-specific DNA recombinase
VINSSDSQDVPRQPDAAIIKVVAQARRWWDDILVQRFPTIRALAHAYDKDERYVARLLPLAFLAPSIVEAILAGRQPVDLTAQDLVTLQDLPVEWNAQQIMLSFSASDSSR